MRRVWIKTGAEIDAIAAAGTRLCAALDSAARAVAPGVTTREIDVVFERTLRAAGAEPVLIGRRTREGLVYPSASCVSVNEEVLHAVPGSRVIGPHDIVTIDASACFEGWCADAAVTVGESARAARLIEAVRSCITSALREIRVGANWSGVAAAAQRAAAARGVRMVPGYDGHGVGRELHEPPRCWLSDGPSDACPDFEIRSGMVLTLEPIVVDGTPDVVVRGDGWTVVTADGSWACHEEVTIALTNDGAAVLTRTAAVP